MIVSFLKRCEIIKLFVAKKNKKFFPGNCSSREVTYKLQKVTQLLALSFIYDALYPRWPSLIMKLWLICDHGHCMIVIIPSLCLIMGYSMIIFWSSSFLSWTKLEKSSIRESNIEISAIAIFCKHNSRKRVAKVLQMLCLRSHSRFKTPAKTRGTKWKNWNGS